ncbi:bifunctional DNA primase/polymerase, partial [Acinetobacter baumannii]
VQPAWNENWEEDQARNYFRRHPDCNIGLLLGDIVDVEGDTAEANYRLSRIVAGYPHPMYSSNRSVHHLFVNPDPQLSI